MIQVNSIRFDSLKLVQDRRALFGTVQIAALSRLSESLLDNTGTLNYQVQGAVDLQDRPLLELQVSGTVQLQCQRCLEGFEHKVHVETAVRLVAPVVLDREYDDDPDALDCVATSVAFDLAELIEDEVLLALPAYPRHEAERCRVSKATEAHTSGAQVKAFSALQALKLKVIQSKE